MMPFFSLATKYSRVRNLLIAYVWHLEDLGKAMKFALTYQEVLAIADRLGWTQTESWRQGAYSTTCPGLKIVEPLDPYKMTPEKWWHRVRELPDDA